ncbi:hypothetical protein TcCL_ESM05425 [Trypanosoma cruzi]|uniref:Uncharacterized protein n=2 Tax=Trypanosoma cruzi TaxID=5693 RepID=Q4DEL3_TRYCC|nr:uncharacterized protein Tc00.1047053507941.130 [Trypanosoma cruzi]EAN90973.1 hypothetical protein, conserved [Trypanosoma cruzi]RNC56995.1 hypothetical protein TcCL_ESM05425 [Trypanosoma cruzi]|eukprot:XP_812824.1 hypothetical protein Tc00.1047053507941.130 [Trypanosoma cruzi strain CL Brener]
MGYMRVLRRMRSALVWQRSSSKCVGDVLDAIIDKAGICSRGDKDERNAKRDGEGVTRWKHRNRPPEGIIAAVMRGSNPFFVSLRPGTNATSKKKETAEGPRVNEAVTRGRGAVPKREKRRGPKRTAAGCGNKQRINAPVMATTIQSCVLSAAGASVASTTPPPPCHARRLTARKLRWLSSGVTKATALFKLFKTLSLYGQSRLVKNRRRHCCRSAEKGNGVDGGEARLHAAFWSALASVLQQRRLHKKQWHALWEAQSDGQCDVQLLRAFPLFGLLVVVERMRWRQDNEDPCTVIAEVVGSALGVVMHESRAFIGVALLREEKNLRVLSNHPLIGEGLSRKATDNALIGDEGLPTGRILRVSKMFPGGTGTAAELRCPRETTCCVVARVAPEELYDNFTAFSPLVGRYL